MTKKLKTDYAKLVLTNSKENPGLKAVTDLTANILPAADNLSQAVWDF